MVRRRVVTYGTRGWSASGEGRGEINRHTDELGWDGKKKRRGEVELKFRESGRGNQELNSANAAGRVGEFN